jgi:hypothetical protein
VKVPELTTAREKFFWAYANLARAHNAVERGQCHYGREGEAVRSGTFNRLTSGTASVASFFKD